jgi:TonB family protein
MTAITHALSTALLHFVWQGILAAFFLWTALFALRKRSANARYAVSCAALAVLTALPVVTVCVLYMRPATARAGIDLAQTVGGFLASPGAARINWLAVIQAWAVPVWSCGVLLFSLRLLWGCRQVSTLRRRGEPAQGAVVDLVARLAARMRVTRPVRILISSVADGPSVVGCLRPLILLPAATVLGLSAEQLEAVLAHELAHIRRYDYLVNILQMLVETLFFYHPAVWWISSRIRHERELCCDDDAVRCCGDAVCYARALTTLERLRVMTPALPLGVTDGPLMYRVQRLLGATTRDYGPSRLPAALAICLAVACFGLNMNRARGQETQSKPGVTVDLRGSSLMHRPPVAYPEAAQAKGVRGTVSVEVTLDANGNVTDAHVLSGPDEFRKTVLQSVLSWHFTPGAAGAKQQVDIAFQPPPAANQPTEGQVITKEYQGKEKKFFFYSPPGGGEPKFFAFGRTAEPDAEQLAAIDQLKARLAALRAVKALPESSAIEAQLRDAEIALSQGEPAGHTLALIEIRGLSEAARNEILSRLPVREGDVLASNSIPAARDIVKQFDEHLELRISLRNDGKYVFQIFPPDAVQ